MMCGHHHVLLKVEKKPFAVRRSTVSTVRSMIFPAIIVVAVMVVGIVLAKGSGHKQAPAPASTASVPAAAQDAAANTQEIAWHQSLPEALAEAKQRKTLIVVDAYADWCHWCKKMDEDTFTNAEVQRRMKDFVPVRINTDNNPELAQRYGVTGLPTTLVLDATGKVQVSQSGYLPPQDYLQLLAQAAKSRTD